MMPGWKRNCFRRPRRHQRASGPNPITPPFTTYMFSLFSPGISGCDVVTEISLESVRRNGYDCSRIRFRLADRLKEEEQGIFAPYHARMKTALLSRVIDATAHEGEDKGPITIVSAPRQLQPNSDSEVPFYRRPCELPVGRSGGAP